MDTAILDAADTLLDADGYAAVTIEAVAVRAGVSRPTIYRRWPSRVAVVMAAVARREDPEVAPGTGSLAGDVRAVARAIAEVMSRPAFRTVLPGLLVDLADDPTARGALIGEWVAPRAASMAEAVRRAVARGEVEASPTVVPDLAELLVGQLLYRALLAGEPADAAGAEVVADRALRALGLDGAERVSHTRP
ncbi:MAG TPA: TetR/AcrR family transcriptional regulator [Cellulomonas sp.]